MHAGMRPFRLKLCLWKFWPRKEKKTPTSQTRSAAAEKEAAASHGCLETALSDGCPMNRFCPTCPRLTLSEAVAVSQPHQWRGPAQHYLARKLARHLLFHSCHSLSFRRIKVAVLFWVVLHGSFGQIALGLCTGVQLQQLWEEKLKLNQQHLAQVPSLTKMKKSNIKMPRTAAFRRV